MGSILIRKSMKTVFKIVLLNIFMYTGMINFAADNPVAEKIVEQSGQYFGLGKEVVLQVTVTYYNGKGDEEVAKFEVLSAKDKQNNLVKYLYPPADRGKFILMQYHDTWVFLPDTKNPVRISPMQRLLGGVTYTDLCKPFLNSDYQAKILRTTTWQKKVYYILELIAKNEEIAYRRVELTVEKDTVIPTKANFFTYAGKLMKTVHYKIESDDTGVKTIQSLVILDQIVKGVKTIAEYTGYEFRELPEKMFTKEYLLRMR